MNSRIVAQKYQENHIHSRGRTWRQEGMHASDSESDDSESDDSDETEGWIAYAPHKETLSLVEEVNIMENTWQLQQDNINCGIFVTHYRMHAEYFSSQEAYKRHLLEQLSKDPDFIPQFRRRIALKIDPTPYRVPGVTPDPAKLDANSLSAADLAASLS